MVKGDPLRIEIEVRTARDMALALGVWGEAVDRRGKVIGNPSRAVAEWGCGLSRRVQPFEAVFWYCGGNASKHGLPEEDSPEDFPRPSWYGDLKGTRSAYDDEILHKRT